MNAAKVMLKGPGSRGWEDRGEHVFVSFPRIGEHIEVKEQEAVFLYEIVAFHHPLDPSSSQLYMYDAGRIYAVQVGPAGAAIERLFEEN